MKLSLTLSILSFSLNSYPQNLFCDLTEPLNSPQLRITYLNNIPTKLALRPYDTSHFQALNIDIKIVFRKNLGDYEGFSVKPRLNEKIHWNNEPDCFKRIGTQWYFHMDHSKKQYSVQLAPYFIKSSHSCITPRVAPQIKPLNCYH